MQLTIKSVNPTAREWGPNYPGSCSVKVYFTDGTVGEYNTKVDKAQPHIDALTALVGQVGEFEISREREFDGVTERTFKNYPGKAQSFGGGGGKGGSWKESWGYSEEGQRFHEERTDRRTALMCAREFCKESKPPDVVAADVPAVADIFYNWLQASVTAPKPAEARYVAVEHREAPASPKQVLNEIWGGPGQCPDCRCPEGARHATKCPARES